jgi:hypothetical protein
MKEQCLMVQDNGLCATWHRYTLNGLCATWHRYTLFESVDLKVLIQIEVPDLVLHSLCMVLILLFCIRYFFLWKTPVLTRVTGVIGLSE